MRGAAAPKVGPASVHATHALDSSSDSVRAELRENAARMMPGTGGEEGIRTLDTALDRITV